MLAWAFNLQNDFSKSVILLASPLTLSRTKSGSIWPHHLPTSALIMRGQLQTVCILACNKVGCIRGQEVQAVSGLAQWSALIVTQWTRPRQTMQQQQVSSYICHILQHLKSYLQTHFIFTENISQKIDLLNSFEKCANWAFVQSSLFLKGQSMSFKVRESSVLKL